MMIAEEGPFLQALVDDPAALEQHVREGGTLESYLRRWRAQRDEEAKRAAAEGPTHEKVDRFLATPLRDGNYWGQEGATVRDYLVELLVQFVAGDASPKYGMVGQSDWEYDLYQPLFELGLIPAWREGWGVGARIDGTDHPEDRTRADLMIVAAIRRLGLPPAPEPS